MSWGSGEARADEAAASLRVALTGWPVGGTLTVDTINSPARHWTAPIDAGGAATLHNLPPALYRLSVTCADGTTAHTSLGLSAADMVTVRLVVEPGQAATLLVVSRVTAGFGMVFTREDLRDLPVTDLSSLLETAAPFVIVDRFDNGGLSTGVPIRVGSRGASPKTASFAFGGPGVQGATLAGVSFLPADLGAFESVAVLSGALSASYASPGTAIVATPRLPGATWRGALDGSFSTLRHVGTNALPNAPSVGRLNAWKAVAVDVGGPINAKTGLFVSAGVRQVKEEVFRRPQQASADGASLALHLVAALRPGDALRAQLAAGRSTGPHDDADQFADRAMSRRDRFVRAYGAWEHAGAGGLQQTFAAGLSRDVLTSLPASTTGGVVDRVADGLVPAPPSDGTLLRWQARYEITAAERRVGHVGHALRATMSFDRSAATSRLIATPTVAETVAAIPARIWIPSLPPGSSSRHIDAIALTLEDRMTLSAAMTLQLGIRADSTSGLAVGAKQGITWRTVSPRASFRIGLPWFSTTVGYARYRAPLSFELLAFGDPGEPINQVRRWDDANDNRVFEPGETGVLIAMAGRGPSLASIDPALRGPRTDEFDVEFERAVGSWHRLRGSLVVRHERQIVRSVNTGVPLSSYRAVLVPDADFNPTFGESLLVRAFDRLPDSFGADRYLLTNGGDSTASYEGAEVAWEFRSPRWYSMAGALAYRAIGEGGNRGFRVDENDQDAVGEHLETPNAGLFSTGRLFVDRAYVLKWSTAYHAPGQFLLAFVARYQDGQPFSRLVVAPHLAQGPDLVSVVKPGSMRFTFAVTIDARVQKTFSFGRGSVALRVDAFNLTNRANEVEESPVSGLGFRRSTAVQPPRTLRFGLKIGF